MPTKIPYNQFGPYFIKQGITPQVIQKSLVDAIKPRHMKGSMKKGPVKISYNASIKDPSVNYTNTLGVYNVTLPIDIDVDIRTASIISKRYQLKAFVPFKLIVETYAPLVIFIQYQPVSKSQINVSGNAGGGDLIYRQVVKEIPGVLAEEVNKALKASKKHRIIDVLKSVQDSLGKMQVAAIKQARFSMKSGSEMPKDIEESGTNGLSNEEPLEALINMDGKPIIDELKFLTKAQTKKVFKANGRARRLNYAQFGHEFLRLVMSPRTVQNEINKSIASNNIKSDFMNKDGHKVAYRAVIEPAGIRAIKFGVFEVQISMNMKLMVAIGGIWNEQWRIKARIPFVLQVVTYANPLIVYLKAYNVNINKIRIFSRQQTATGVAWGSIEKELYTTLQKEVNKAVRESNKDRTINISQKISSMGSANIEASNTTVVNMNSSEGRLRVSKGFSQYLSSILD